MRSELKISLRSSSCNLAKLVPSHDMEEIIKVSLIVETFNLCF